MAEDTILAEDGQTGGTKPPTLTLGFIPLVDCAPLVVALEQGFAEAEGIRLALVRETSWANIRDRVALGYFDGAHMLAPMPIASSLGLGRPPVAMVAPFSLGLGGNAITLAPDLWDAILAMDPAVAGFDPLVTARALAAVVARRRAGKEPPLTLAVVHPFSGHNYELRYWLAAAGLDPDRDLRLTVLPPSVMADALRDRTIDGFCAGEPWNSFAVEAGVGVVAVTKSALWRQGPEKVLGLRADFAEREPERVAALIRALARATHWAGRPENRTALAHLLAQPAYVGAPAATIERCLSGRLSRHHGAAPAEIPDFQVFHAHAANFPWQSHALWFYSQMVRWGHIAHDAAHAEVARRVYRPDLYRAALAGLGVDLPRASAKVEGALKTLTPVASRNGTMMLGPDGFFDGRLFDPDRLEDYLASFGKPDPAANVSSRTEQSEDLGVNPPTAVEPGSTTS